MFVIDIVCKAYGDYSLLLNTMYICIVYSFISTCPCSWLTIFRPPMKCSFFYDPFFLQFLYDFISFVFVCIARAMYGNLWNPSEMQSIFVAKRIWKIQNGMMMTEGKDEKSGSWREEATSDWCEFFLTDHSP